MEQQSGAGLSSVNEKKISHQAYDVDSQPGRSGMVGLHTASNVSNMVTTAWFQKGTVIHWYDSNYS